jgi:hypothetical protein
MADTSHDNQLPIIVDLVHDAMRADTYSVEVGMPSELSHSSWPRHVAEYVNAGGNSFLHVLGKRAKLLGR